MVWSAAASAAKKGLTKMAAEVADAWQNPNYDAKAKVDQALKAAPKQTPDPHRWQEYIKNREFHGRRYK